MLSVTLTLTATEQSTKLLALLDTLPFVEVQSRQQLVLPDEPALLDIFNRYLSYKYLGFSCNSYGGAMKIDLFKGIDEAVGKELEANAATELYAKLAHNPALFEGQLLHSGNRQAHCVYRRGCRVRYEVDANNSSLLVFHVAKATPPAA